MDSKLLEAVGMEIDRHLTHLLRPGGEIDKRSRKPVADWLSSPVILEGAGGRVKTTWASWLTLVTKAHQAGWPKGPGQQTLAAEDAKLFASALAKADLEQKWVPLVAAVMMVARAGEFRVVIGAETEQS